MKIAVIFDSKSKGGGGYFQSLNSSLLLKKLENNIISLSFITPDKDTFRKLKDEKLNTIFFSNVLFAKLFYQIAQIHLFKFLFAFFKIKNPFVRFLKKNKFDLVIFLGPSWFIKLCDEINFVSNIYDINFKLDNQFPEYESSSVFNSKNFIVKKSVDRAFKILVDTQRSKNELSKYYNCESKKIVIQPFTPLLPNINKKINHEKILLKLGLHNKKFFFYPAQFWAHKNHKYIIDAVEILNQNNNNISFVFCGSDKGNLNYIKSNIDEKGLQDKFLIYKFINDEEVITLYKNCMGLIMPSYVARSTLPMYEAFYFKIPVFYSKGVLDEELEKLVTTIDLNKPEDLTNKVRALISGELDLNDKIKKAFDYYGINCSENLFLDNYKKIINDYTYLSKRWKNNYR